MIRTSDIHHDEAVIEAQSHNDYFVLCTRVGNDAWQEIVLDIDQRMELIRMLTYEPSELT